jgi:hypothetical protein
VTDWLTRFARSDLLVLQSGLGHFLSFTGRPPGLLASPPSDSREGQIGMMLPNAPRSAKKYPAAEKIVSFEKCQDNVGPSGTALLNPGCARSMFWVEQEDNPLVSHRFFQYCFFCRPDWEGESAVRVGAATQRRDRETMGGNLRRLCAWRRLGGGLGGRCAERPVRRSRAGVSTGDERINNNK